MHEEDTKAWYLRFETKSWTSATQELSGIECGAYINLLAWSWDHKGILNDDEVICRLSRCPIEPSRSVLDKKWKLIKGYWFNERLEVERTRCLSRSVKAHDAAAKRWNANASSKHMLEQCERNAIQSQSQSQSQSQRESESQNNTTDSLEPRTKRARRQVSPITWTDKDGWQGITASDKIDWSIAYPNCAIDMTLSRMHLWLLANPTKSHKSNWLRFIASWFARTREDGGNLPPSRPTESNF